MKDIVIIWVEHGVVLSVEENVKRDKGVEWKARW